VLTYRDRLELAAERYKLIQQDHPRRAWGPVKDGHANIPNTAEVLAILRVAGELYESEAVQRGVRYLATRVYIHPRPMGERGGRWPLTRFLVYGLLGLTQWEEWKHDRVEREATDLESPVTVRGAVEHSVKWLQAHRVGNGWPDRADVPQCSVLQTATAILALDRVGMLPNEVQAARDLLGKVQDRKDGSWPEIVASRSYKAGGSAAHTALAVLALMGGGSEHRRHAERGCDWLLKHAGDWQRATHPERHEGVEPWEHMTFGLALRACLRAGVDPLAPALKPSIDLLDELWVTDAKEWQGGPGERPSVHGSHAVVLAYEELRRAQRRVDPVVFFGLIRAGMAADTEAGQRFCLDFREAMIMIIDARDGETLAAVDLGERSWRLVRRVADLQSGSNGGTRLVPFSDLADISKDIKTMIRRINGQVRTATGGRLQQLVHVPRGENGCVLTVRLASPTPGSRS
jgi:hypothetical protein